MRTSYLVFGLLAALSLPTFAGGKTLVWTCPVPIYMRASVDTRERLPASVQIFEHRISRQSGKYTPGVAPSASNQTISVDSHNPVLSVGGN